MCKRKMIFPIWKSVLLLKKVWNKPKDAWRHSCQHQHWLQGAASLIALSYTCLSAATLLPGFTESLVANLPSATAMEFAPDGRLFVCLQGGDVRVIKNGALLTTPFVTVSAYAGADSGLLGIAFDPNFVTNGYVYLHYTATVPTIHNRVSHVTASGDIAVPGSEVSILDLPTATNPGSHKGGAIHFGTDGKLYVTEGDDRVPSSSQDIMDLRGKLLRINPDGTIPADNPFGASNAVWALGLRNPFTFVVQSSTGRILINDVGESTWEEIDDGIAGANYGWPNCEGPYQFGTSNPCTGYTNPIFWYGHGAGDTVGCSIVGGAFYNPATVTFPSDYVGKYFFADLCQGWIRRFDPSTGIATGFATGISSPVDLKVASDGSLYYLIYGTGGGVYRIRYSPVFFASGNLEATSGPLNICPGMAFYEEYCSFISCADAINWTSLLAHQQFPSCFFEDTSGVACDVRSSCP
ncbi:MAG: PQQ-dependent sugar dehydrogenase [Acidobacteria bacterium]|nr:PQQ-dependent sugar dehydrogenase [Acidobacteriota bacterium]MBI3658499.1 PQQ-dependent sugar dehydrogenase [Acidobacteriota bacterium]